MTTIGKKLLDYINAFKAAFNAEPKVILVTATEALQCEEMLWRIQTVPTPSNEFSIWGQEVKIHPYGDLARDRTLTLPLTEFNVVSYSSELMAEEKTWRDEVRREMGHQLIAHIASNVTELKVEVDCDPWLPFKRLCFLDKCFPARKKTLTIDGRILYPHVSVTLPHQKHVVKFSLKDV